MRADPALSLAYEIPLSSIKHLVEDLTFDEQAWVTRLTRYDDYGSFYKRRSAIQLRALRSFHREQGVNPVELAHARLSVARNLLMNDLQPTQQNIASIVDDMLRTRVVRDAIPMRGSTLLVTHAEMLDSDVTNGNPKGSPHFGTSAQIEALSAKSTSFAHVNGNDSNAPSAILEKLVAAPTDLRFVFLGHGGETNDNDVAIYLSDGHALSGGKAQENASTVKIKASDFATALVRRYRRTGIDPTRDTYYFSGCQLKQFVDIIQTMLVSQGIVPPNMTAAAEHGQSNFISHDGIYGPRMDEAYILSKTWGDFRRSSTSVEFRSKPPVFSPSILLQPDGRVRFLQIGAVDAGISAVQLG